MYLLMPKHEVQAAAEIAAALAALIGLRRLTFGIGNLPRYDSGVRTAARELLPLAPPALTRLTALAMTSTMCAGQLALGGCPDSLLELTVGGGKDSLHYNTLETLQAAQPMAGVTRLELRE